MVWTWYIPPQEIRKFVASAVHGSMCAVHHLSIVALNRPGCVCVLLCSHVPCPGPLFWERGKKHQCPCWKEWVEGPAGGAFANSCTTTVCACICPELLISWIWNRSVGCILIFMEYNIWISRFLLRVWINSANWFEQLNSVFSLPWYTSMMSHNWQSGR